MLTSPAWSSFWDDACTNPGTWVDILDPQGDKPGIMTIQGGPYGTKAAMFLDITGLTCAYSQLPKPQPCSIRFLALVRNYCDPSSCPNFAA